MDATHGLPNLNSSDDEEDTTAVAEAAAATHLVNSSDLPVLADHTSTTAEETTVEAVTIARTSTFAPVVVTPTGSIDKSILFTQQLIQDFAMEPKGSSKSTMIPREITTQVETDDEDDMVDMSSPAREEEQANGKCFDNIHLLSPTYFDEVEERNEALIQPSVQAVNNKYKRSLSDMIHPMNRALFGNDVLDDSLDTSLVSEDNAVPQQQQKALASRSPTSIVEMHRELLRLEKLDETVDNGSIISGKSKLSAFTSSTLQDQRIIYTLAMGKQGMSSEERATSKSLLLSSSNTVTPPQQVTVPTTEITDSQPKQLTVDTDLSNDETTEIHLSVLLVDMQRKVFEIVTVPHDAATTVGDILSQVRMAATDPSLASQTYISLCNDTQELAAHMLPVHLILHQRKTVSPRQRHATTPVLRKYDDKEQQQAATAMQQEGIVLLLAVPEGSSAAAVRRIKQVLWTHPRIQKWWEKAKQQSLQPHE